MKPYTFRTIIEPDARGTYHGYVPALKGCHTWGTSIAETKKRLREAIEVYLASMAAHGEPIPQDSSFESFETVFIARGKKMRTRRIRQYA